VTVAREQFVSVVRSFDRTPYRHLGRSRLGVDCLGVLVCAARELELIPVDADWREYTTNTADYRLVEEIEASGYLDRLRSWTDARPGDVVLQKFHKRLPASHVLICTQFDGTYWTVLHASRASGRVEEVRVANPERCFAAYRMKGVGDG
jgi:hypothetical protein